MVNYSYMHAWPYIKTTYTYMLLQLYRHCYSLADTVTVPASRVKVVQTLLQSQTSSGLAGTQAGLRVKGQSGGGTCSRSPALSDLVKSQPVARLS